MNHLFLRGFGVSWAVSALIWGAGCSTSGTNTGNGSPTCPYFGACSEPVNATGPDGTTYRGRVYPDVTIASDPSAASAPNPPVATLSFSGANVELADAGCKDPAQRTSYDVQIFISAADSSVDASGTLHVHATARDGYYASGPSTYLNGASTPGWSVDLALTAGGDLTATLSTSASSGGADNGYPGRGGASGTSGDGGTGRPSADGGKSGTSADGGAGGIGPLVSHATLRITLIGPIASGCGTSIRLSDGSSFKFPCRQTVGCDVSAG